MVALAIPATVDSVVGESKDAPNLSIGVRRFEDRRREPSVLGVKAGRFGSLDSYTFVVSGADAGQAAADALVHYLTRRGRTSSTIRIGTPVTTDVIISGEIVDLGIDVRSDWFFTRLSAKATLVLEAENRMDGSRVRLTVRGTDSRKIFWFEPKHAQALINQVLVESYAQWSAGIKVDGRALRLT
jgi:hypothetical protein